MRVTFWGWLVPLIRRVLVRALGAQERPAHRRRRTRCPQARLSLAEVESPALPQNFHNQTRERRRFTALFTL